MQNLENFYAHSAVLLGFVPTGRLFLFVYFWYSFNDAFDGFVGDDEAAEAFGVVEKPKMRHAV